MCGYLRKVQILVEGKDIKNVLGKKEVGIAYVGKCVETERN
jgi:hypothetical protein